MPGESGIFKTPEDAQSWANSFNENPQNAHRIAQQDFNTKGQPIVEIEDRVMPTQGEREFEAKKRATLTKMDEFESLIDENLTGPFQGRITKLKNKWGLGDSPESQSLEVMAESMIREAYTDAGKQLSDKELKRLVAFFPIDISVADKKFRQQFRILKDEVIRSLGMAEDVQESLGMNIGIEVGATASNPNGDTIRWAGKSWQKVQ